MHTKTTQPVRLQHIATIRTLCLPERAVPEHGPSGPIETLPLLVLVGHAGQFRSTALRGRLRLRDARRLRASVPRFRSTALRGRLRRFCLFRFFDYFVPEHGPSGPIETA